MARLYGIGIQAYHNAESGYSRIGLDNALKIARRLGVTLDFVYLDNRYGLPHVLAIELEKLERTRNPKRA